MISQIPTQWNALTGKVRPRKVMLAHKTKELPQPKYMKFNLNTMPLQVMIFQTLMPWNALTGREKPKKVMHVLKTKELPQLKNTLFNFME